jgi:hypothetical protein
LLLHLLHQCELLVVTALETSSPSPLAPSLLSRLDELLSVRLACLRGTGGGDPGRASMLSLAREHPTDFARLLKAQLLAVLLLPEPSTSAMTGGCLRRKGHAASSPTHAPLFSRMLTHFQCMLDAALEVAASAAETSAATASADSSKRLLFPSSSASSSAISSSSSPASSAAPAPAVLEELHALFEAVCASGRIARTGHVLFSRRKLVELSLELPLATVFVQRPQQQQQQQRPQSLAPQTPPDPQSLSGARSRGLSTLSSALLDPWTLLEGVQGSPLTERMFAQSRPVGAS